MVICPEKDFIANWVKFAGCVHFGKDLYIQRIVDSEHTMSLGMWLKEDEDEFKLLRTIEELDAERFLHLEEGKKYSLEELGIAL